MTSGYTHCACRDCFDIVVSDDMEHPDYCHECVKAGCPDYKGYVGADRGCQREETYEEEETEET